MPQTLTFTKVFSQDGNSQKGPWTRWDFKTADGDKYQIWNDEGLKNQIVLHQPTTVEIEVKSSGGYTNKIITAVLGSSRGASGR